MADLRGGRLIHGRHEPLDDLVAAGRRRFHFPVEIAQVNYLVRSADLIAFEGELLLGVLSLQLSHHGDGDFSFG